MKQSEELEKELKVITIAGIVIAILAFIAITLKILVALHYFGVL